MPWSKVSETTWRRPLSANELLGRNIASCTKAFDRNQWMVNGLFSLDRVANADDLPCEVICQAWIALRYRSPFIAVMIDGVEFVYETPSNDELEAWTANTYIVHNDEHDTADTFKERIGWSDLCTLHWFPHTSQLLFRIHHWLIDGRGMIHLGRMFFTALATILDQDKDYHSPIFGDEWRRLQLALEEVSDLPTEAAEADREKGMQLALSLVASPTAGLSYSGPTMVPGASKTGTLIVKSHLDVLLAACRKEGITLSSAVHAALTAAVFDAAPPEQREIGYNGWLVWDCRKYLAKASDEWPMGCYIKMLPLVIFQGEFLENAKTIRKAYQSLGSGPDFAYREIYVPYLQALANLLLQPLPEGAPPPTNPVMSSLGAVDRYLGMQYGPLTIKDIDVSVDVTSSQLVVYQLTWNGVFKLVVDYNDAYWSAEHIEGFLKNIEGQLLDGLAVE